MRPLSICIALALTTGCVSRHAHTELEADYASLQAQNTQLQEEVDRSRAAQIDLATQVWSLKLEIDRLEMELAEAEELDQATRERYIALVRDLTPMMNEGEILVRYGDGEMTLVLAEAVFFDTAEASLSTTGLNKVARLAQIMRDHPHWDYQVRGHTDARPIDNEDFSSNWDLGAERAVGVVEQLVQHGEFPEDSLSAASFAHTEPVAPNTTPEARAVNRRVEIVVTPVAADSADAE